MKIDYEIQKNSKKLQKKTCFDHFYPNMLTRGRATVRDRKTFIHGIGTQRVKWFYFLEFLEYPGTRTYSWLF